MHLLVGQRKGGVKGDTKKFGLSIWKNGASRKRGENGCSRSCLRDDQFGTH